MITAKPGCPLCWANGMLKGGEAVAETAQLYTYAFTNENGEMQYALINTKEHHADMRTLTPEWGEEFSDLYS